MWNTHILDLIYIERMGWLTSFLMGLTLFAQTTTSTTEEVQTTTNVDIGCRRQLTCGACLAADPNCAWCMQPDFTNVSRCDHEDKMRANQCEDRYTVNPDNPDPIYTQNEDPSDTKEDKDAIQLSPQKMELRLRPNKPLKFNVSFRQAANYPVDMYYVINLSSSMEAFKERVTKLIEQIADAMGEMTSNVRFGFGSFADKNIRPISRTEPKYAEKPCPTCSPMYSFKHHLGLTTNVSQFKNLLNNTKLTTTLDGAEDALTAIVQAVTCKDIVGWRDSARKMLILATDDPFHIAGDGKIAGIITPNDGRCHVVDGEYTEATNQDYPSVYMVARSVAEADVALMIGLVGNKAKTYKKTYDLLTQVILGSVVTIIKEGEAGMLNFVKENFEKLRGEVRLRSNEVEDLDVNIRTKCKSDDWVDGNMCANLTIGENVTFEVTIQALSCPKSAEARNNLLIIQPVGVTEKLEINVQTICDCDCEKNNFTGVGEIGPLENSSISCSNSGTYMCGQCECDPGYFGEVCECHGSSLDGKDEDLACRMTNSSSVCQGRGQCVCGQCDCDYVIVSQPDLKYSGKYCECNDRGCEVYKQQICGGPTRGECACGRCTCKSGYTGTSCNCTTDPRDCSTGEDEVCSGNGECRCGQCECAPMYEGPTCRDCPSCTKHALCDSNKACVECTPTGSMSEQDCAARCPKVTEVEYDIKESGVDVFCEFRDADQCVRYFSYSPDEIKVQLKKCPRDVNVLAVGLGVSVAVLVVGVTLLLGWKGYVTVHDKREYARFIDEQQNARWEQSDNPLFKPPNTTIQNPTFVGDN